MIAIARVDNAVTLSRRRSARGQFQTAMTSIEKKAI
jgi:hypothetical protein